MFLAHLVPAATPDVPKVGGTDPILAFAELPLEEEGEGQGEIGGGEAALEAMPAVRKQWAVGSVALRRQSGQSWVTAGGQRGTSRPGVRASPKPRGAG